VKVCADARYLCTGVSGAFHRVNSTVGRILFLDIYTTTLLLEVATQRTL
jgi:hypothetical protein